jgi:acyl carrier protein
MIFSAAVMRFCSPAVKHFFAMRSALCVIFSKRQHGATKLEKMESMTMSIENEIRKFIMENFILDGDGNPSNEDSLLEKGIIDSTGVLELVAFIEQTYSFKIKDEELVPENLDSIKNISQFIQNKLDFSREGLNREAVRT